MDRMNVARISKRALGAALVTSIVFAAPASAKEKGSKWLTSYKSATTAAKKDSKVILADFTGSDWCGWCIKLDKEVFETPEFKSWAAKNVVLLEVDFPRSKKLDDATKKQNEELQQKFEITGYPTIVFIDADGKELGRSGYVAGGPGPWIQSAEEAMKKKDTKEGGESSQDGAPAEASETTEKPVQAGEWVESYAAALATAKAENKLILVDFTGSDWCGWCKKLKAEVFDTKEFKTWAAKHVVLFEADYPRSKPQSDELKAQNAKLQKEFKITGFPTILFLDKTGKKVGRLGYEAGGPTVWLKKAQDVLDDHRN